MVRSSLLKRTSSETYRSTILLFLLLLTNSILIGIFIPLQPSHAPSQGHLPHLDELPCLAFGVDDGDVVLQQGVGIVVSFATQKVELGVFGRLQ